MLNRVMRFLFRVDENLATRGTDSRLHERAIIAISSAGFIEGRW